MDTLKPHVWNPIEDLPSNWQESLVSAEVGALVRVWHEQAVELRQQELYHTFLVKLRRQWAIETGIIEGLYTLSEGATRTLIEKGLDAALITHDDGSSSVEDMMHKIKDQYRAIEGLYEFVSGNRPLGKSYIRELHQVLTAHQATYDAIDTLGNPVVRDLPRGVWKNLPNNVRATDGTIFEFCPPEHVEAEMDRLVTMYTAHQEIGVPADVESAWLHHRFTLIHPFTDGNGRVSRCLATLVLLKASWLPLVVTRHDRPRYIEALRSADDADLRPLVEFIGGLQKKAVREALSLTENVIQEQHAIKSILQSVKLKFAERRRDHSQKLDIALKTGDALQILASHRLEEISAQVSEALKDENSSYKAWMGSGERNSDKAKYNYHQTVQCAKKLNYFANFQMYQAWTSLTILASTRVEILFSFHGIGYALTGVLGCAAMIYSKELTDTKESVIGEVIPLSEEPFEFTYAEDPHDVEQRFQKWLDETTKSGLSYWQKLV